MALPVLNIPTQDLAHRPKPYLRPKLLSRWLGELPVVDTSAAVHLFLDKVKTLNSSRYPVAERMALMYVLHPVATQLARALADKYNNAEIPLARKERMFADLSKVLLTSFAAGYKLVVSELVVQKQHRKTEALMLQEAVYFAIQFLSWALVDTFSIYDPVTEGIWHDLHQLYNYAENSDLQNIQIDDPHPDSALPIMPSIDHVYKRILLLALAEPYQLMHGEAWEIYRLVSIWTTECEFLPVIQEADEGDYAVDMSADAPPRYVTQDLIAQEITGRVIDISKVNKKLDELIQMILKGTSLHEYLADSGVTERKQRDILLRLAEHWHGTTERSEPRIPAGDSVRITAGINACHYFISMRATFTPEMDELKIQSDKAGNYGQEDKKSFFATRYSEALKKDKRHIHTGYSLEEWQQNNLSTQGIALRCYEDHYGISIKVGEIVAYRYKGKYKGRWQMGVVRWVKSDAKKILDLGIMDIARSSVPVAVKAMSGTGKGTDYFRALLIPYQVSLKQSRSIVLPANIYDISTVLVVNLGKRMFHVRLTHLILFTSSIHQYGFEILETPKQFALHH